MKFYFAGESSEWASIRSWIIVAHHSGHEVTFDWTYDVERLGRGVPSMDLDTLQGAAERDIDGARDCDIFVLFVTAGIYGAMTELGAALVTPTVKEVWLIGPASDARFSIFFRHPKAKVMNPISLHKFFEQKA